MVDFVLRGQGVLTGSSIDATPGPSGMRVTGEYQDGTEREVAWGVETTGTSPIMALELQTDDVPKAIRIRFMTFGVFGSETITAPSLAALTGKQMSVGPVEATVRTTHVRSRTIVIRLSFSPPAVGESPSVMGLETARLQIAGHTFRDEGLSRWRPSATRVAQILVLVGEDLRAITGQSGPAQLTVDGVMFQNTSELRLLLPGGCE